MNDTADATLTNDPEVVGYRLRGASIEDAAFILDLRRDAHLSRYISDTPDCIKAQRNWLYAYLERYRAGIEYYFILEKDRRPIGTCRLHDIVQERFIAGSWLIRYVARSFSKGSLRVRASLAYQDAC